MNLYAIAPLLSFILLIVGAYYLLSKGIRRISNWVFSIALFMLALAEFGNFMALVSLNPASALFWQKWVLVAFFFVAFCWMLLSLVFARGDSFALARRGWWYLAGLFIFAIWFFSRLPRASLIDDAGWRYGFILGSSGRLFFIFILLSLVIILLNFENTYRSAQGAQIRKLKYIIRGIGTFIGTYMVLTSLAVLFSYVDMRWTLFGSIAIIIGFILVARSILRYGLADTQVYVGRQAVYTSATLSIVGAYLVVVGLIAQLFMRMGFSLHSFVSFLAAFAVFFVLIALIFSRSLKERLRLAIDRSLYKNKYDYRREWQNLSERLSTILDLSVLIREIKQAVKQVLRAEKVELVLEGVDSDFMQWLLRLGEPISVERISVRFEKVYAANKQFLSGLGSGCVLVALSAKQKPLGALVVARQADAGAFSNEDMELLKIISQQVSIAVLNARLSEELVISRETEHFHKLSSFIIHDLKNFVSTLSMIAQNAKSNFDNPQFQKDALETISGTIGKMNNLMEKLSALPEKLELKAESVDINALIDEVIAKSGIERIPSVKLFKQFNQLPQLKIDKEYIQKVIQNLLLNAIEASSNSGEIIISTDCPERSNAQPAPDTRPPTPDTLHPTPPAFNGKYVEISVSDKGCGMSGEFIQQRLFRPFQSSKRKGIGIGLYQCKTIVEAHGGFIDVTSKLGEGTRFVVKIPV